MDRGKGAVCYRKEGSKRFPASQFLQFLLKRCHLGIVAKRKKKMVLFKLELLLSTIDKLGLLIFSALYRVMCAKNNIDFVSSLLVARVKFILGLLTRL